MRAAISELPEWVMNDNQVVGLSLGADHVAEHEFGIKGLHKLFSMDSSKIGIERFLIHDVPDICVKTGTVYRKPAMLVVASEYSWDIENIRNGKNVRLAAADCGIYVWGDKNIFTAWDEKSFGILAIGKEDTKRLEALVQAIQDKDCCIMLGKRTNPFAPCGLNILKYNCVPEDIRNQMREEDLEAIRLYEAAEKTGIYEILKKAGKGYIALTPKWSDYFKEPKYETKYPVVFWLNPMQQSIYNYGWFTVEELKLWAKDMGPIAEK